MEEQEYNITLLDIGEVEGSSLINRRAALRNYGKEIRVDMSVRVVPDLEKSTVGLVVTASYIVTGKLLRERLLTCSAFANFEIKDLRRHVEINGEEVSVDGHIMMMMLGIATGALRGIISVRAAGTALAKRPLPIVDLTALLYRLRYGSTSTSI